MYALPVHMNWPTFYASKQTKATDKHLFFQQMSSTHSKRFNAIVDHLRNGKKVVSTGLAGIGKSTELNAYLMKFLANIGNPNWPPEVWYRFDSNLLQFYLNGDEPKVKYLRKVLLDDLLIFTEDYRSEPLEKRPVLFLELAEDEVNPRSHIATLLQPSNRDVYTLTKEFEKSEAIYMLINPPACEDLCTIACLQAQFGSNSMFRGMNTNSIIELITNRVNILGPIPRSVLSNDIVFESKVKYVDKNVTGFYEGSRLDSLSESNVPRHSKDYVAPFVNDETAVPYLLGGGDPVRTSLRILSPHLARLIATACTDEAKKKLLQRYDFVYRIEEEIVRYGLMNRSSSTQVQGDVWLAENWMYFKSGKDGAIIKELDKIQYVDIGFTPCSDSIYFDSIVLYIIPG